MLSAQVLQRTQHLETESEASGALAAPLSATCLLRQRSRPVLPPSLLQVAPGTQCALLLHLLRSFTYLRCLCAARQLMAPRAAPAMDLLSNGKGYLSQHLQFVRLVAVSCSSRTANGCAHPSSDRNMHIHTVPHPMM